ncbi:MAG: isoprenylcysteine carboxylmethyltransferase family protein [Acidobacteriales bacterium]|nr:isoprenylcysteine carboxylmethyltransferase family protein [Terriglobales bacterium]
MTWERIARRSRVPLGFAFVAFYLWRARPTLTSILLGLVFILPGLALRALASGHLRKNEELAVSGPYAYTRNPLYLGSLILAAGFVFAGRSWIVAAIAFLILMGIYLPVIKGEEEFLRQKFPEFAEYALAVPRLWPRLRSASAQRVQFSSALYLKHHEYDAALGSAAILGALLAKAIWFAN